MGLSASDSACNSTVSVCLELSRSHSTWSGSKRKIQAVGSDSVSESDGSASFRSEKLQRVRGSPSDCARACASDCSSPSAAAIPLDRRERDERNTISDNVFGPSVHQIGDFFDIDCEVLGSGQFGTVRRCAHRETRLPFACKSISKRHLSTEDARDKLRREVRTMQKAAGHPGVVQLRGVFEDADSVHLVMDLCDAGELFGLIAHRGSLTEEEAALVLWQLASGVAFCHSRGVLHRDLKPENILLSMENLSNGSVFPSETGACNEADCNEGDADFLAVRIADFGLAIELQSHEVARGAAGSPLYVAPEVLTGAYGYTADVWSLGVILFVMLSGRPPFWGNSNQEIFDSVVHAPVSFPGSSWDGVSAEAKTLIRCMLQKDPVRRPSAAKVLSHPWVQRHLRGEDSTSRNVLEGCKGTRLGQVCL
ncbi:hypothetical protein CLOM_g17987 [Closterium sp. NIES-68]|nr:hypothetical protein CLOM_g17987 [Closterium sp. NIES-68]GJP70109.1 hypothetical protein CLOP_g1094 [Closterium sp. NIES-67]